MLPGMATPMLIGSGNVVFTVPTTWNPSDKNASIVLSNGNLTATGPVTTGACGVRGTNFRRTGKYYFEITVVSANDTNIGAYVGISDSTAASLTDFSGFSNANGFLYASPGGIYYNTNATPTTGSTYLNADVISVAVNMSGRRIFVAKNNVWQTHTPGVGAGWDYVTTSPITPYFLASTATTVAPAVTLNVGSSSFVYTKPSGYLAWG
jgi:hypothetical protein